MPLLRSITFSLASVLFIAGCAAQDRNLVHDQVDWRTVRLTATTNALIDSTRIVVVGVDAHILEQLQAAGFTVISNDMPHVEIRRSGADQVGFSKDLQRLSRIVPPQMVHLVLAGGVRAEVGDALLITAKNPARLVELLARHRLQDPVPVVGDITRVVTAPRGDLLQLDARLAALRADPDVATVESDLFTIRTLK